MNTTKALGQLGACLLLVALATTAQARGGWDGNGVQVSGIAVDAVRAAEARPATQRGIQVRSIQLPQAATAARHAVK